MKRVVGVSALVVLLCAVAAAPTSSSTGNGAPAGLHAFLVRPNEAPQPFYPRTPSFAWNPERRTGGTYDFQLATSKSFDDSSTLFSYSKLRIPAVAIAHQLPWMTGDPDALWVHVRWESANGSIVTPWSKPFGFNMRWLNSDVPQQLPAPEGLVRWKPIEGATSYQVLYTDFRPAVSFETTTNVADEREYFTFHSSMAATVHWRVRAIRFIDDSDVLKNGLPRASYGPWSPTFTTVNPPQAAGALAPTATISDAWNKAGQPAKPDELTPGFAWNPSPEVLGDVGSVGSSLYRVYIFTDKDCVNQVFAGSIVGSPAFAPRTVGGTFALPQDTKTLGYWDGPPYLESKGSEGNAFDATGAPVTSNELPGGSVGGKSSAGSSSGTGNSKGTAGASGVAGTPGSGAAGVASVDLWDSGWPSGRYYWTVVPIVVHSDGVPSDSTSTTPIEYQDAAVPQDQCEAGDVMSFGKVSQPVVTSSGTPWVSGLDPSGREIASAAKVPVVHDLPLVAWEPAIGATTYEVQLSRKSYPWKAAWDQTTAATSIVLPLGTKQVGTWWYRIRGINPALPQGAQAMSWSAPVKLTITGDRFHLVK
jgi:hypothetical protein